MRGFSYLWVLILTLTLLSLIGSSATVIIRETQSHALDREKTQAFAYAESGLVYQQNIQPLLPCKISLTNGYFEISQKQGIIYATGVCGRGKQTLRSKGQIITPWHE
jgi:hypothetical protein